MSIINFTVEYDLFSSQTDSTDVGIDADLVPLIGTVTFTPQVTDDKAVLAPSYTPRPAGFKLMPFVGYLDSDGQLKSAPGGEVGVRLWANDPVLELDRLTYKVDFNLRTSLGAPVTVDGGYFEAPATDGTINLTDVLQSTGVPSASVVQQQLIYAHELVDSTDIGVDLVTTANAETAREILEVNRKNVVDIRDYVTTGTTFDLAAVVGAMESGNGSCYVPPGDWTPNAFNVGLDETNVTGTGTATSRFTYKFFGSGKQSRILFPGGMSSGDYLLVANSSNTSNFYAHPKIVLEDLAFGGSSSPNGGVLKVNQRSFTASRVYLGALLNGFYATGYCDVVRLSHVYAESMTANGWVYQGTGNGDGLVVDQLLVYGSNAVKLTACTGASIRGSLSGWYEFIRSTVTMQDNHIEGDGSTTSTPVVTIKSSNVNVLSGYYEAKKYRPTFSINDATGYPSTVVFHESVNFSQRVDDVSSTYGAEKATDVDIVNLDLRGEVTFKSCKSSMFLASTSKGNGGGDYSIVTTPKITSTGIAAIQTALTNRPLAPSGNSTIRYVGSGVWEIAPTDRKPIPTQSIAATYLAASANNSSYVTTELTAGTYYYKAWTVDVAGRATNPSSEASVIISSGNPIPQVTLNSQRSPARIRVVRGTTSGNYTHYAELLAPNKVNYLYDQGSYIGGAAWQSWSGTPAVPTASGTYNETASGAYFYDGGNAQIWASSAPAAGTWAQGDRCYNTSPGLPGWVCTVAGTPGTWVAMADVSSTQTFTNKDLTSATNTFPTFNQNTTGSAAKLTTARTINGVAFDGTANITVEDSTKEPSITAGTTAQYWRGDKSWQTLNSAAVGLSNVDNTADNAKSVASAAALTTARTINQVSFNGTADITVSGDLPCTQLRVATNRSNLVSGTNGAIYQRVRGSGSISKIGLWVKNSSGNISVAVYSNSGTGTSAVPNSRLATSGAVACPSVGYAEISLGTTVTVKEGDWMAISADNLTASFASPLTDSPASNDFGKGVQYSQSSAHPLPSTPSSLTATVGYDIGLKGIA